MPLHPAKQPQNERRGQHQDGKGQHVLHEAEQHGGIVVEQTDGLDANKPEQSVRDALVAIWLEKPETARRVRQRIVTVIDWAIAKG